MEKALWKLTRKPTSDVLLWTPTNGRAKAGRPARTYIQQLCEDTGCCPEDLPRAMNDREGWRERVRDIRATSERWWWWWWYIYISISIYIYIYIVNRQQVVIWTYSVEDYGLFLFQNLQVKVFVYSCYFFLYLGLDGEESNIYIYIYILDKNGINKFRVYSSWHSYLGVYKLILDKTQNIFI